MEVKRTWSPAYVKSKNCVKMSNFTIYYTLYYLSSSLAKLLTVNFGNQRKLLIITNYSYLLAGFAHYYISLAEGLQFILEISATYRLVSYVARTMHDFQEQC